MLTQKVLARFAWIQSIERSAAAQGLGARLEDVDGINNVFGALVAEGIVERTNL